MKHFSIVFVLVVFSAFVSTSFAQTNWTKYPGNPVLTEGPSGSWDEQGVLALCVYFDGTTYHMWYTGGLEGHGRLGYATSPDRITWTKFAGNPILFEGPPGSWDERGPGSPTVIFDGTTYHMWYDASDSNGVARIGYANSPDKITWSQFGGNPVLDVGPPGSWDDEGVAEPWVIYDGIIYRMWYGGSDGTTRRIGYATSPDGITWTKHASNPVLTEGSAGAWDSEFAASPEVLFDGNDYQMWYGGFDGDFGRKGYATSPDGITWTKFANNPVLDVGPPGTWDDLFLGRGGVIFEGSIFYMWYAGASSPYFIWRIGYAIDSTMVGIGDDVSNELPRKFDLYPNYPNPFNPTTTIEFSLPHTEFVTLNIYNTLGEKVATLVSENLPAGSYKYEWDATGLASGVYLYRLEADNFVEIPIQIS